MVELDKSNIFAPPQTIAAPFQNSADVVEFFTVAPKKMLIMSIGTLGLYLVYWFFRQWKAQQIAHQLNVMPRMRAIFSIFFTHSLLRRVHEAAAARNVADGFEKYDRLASTFVGLYVFSTILSYSGGVAKGWMNTLFVIGYLAALIYSFMPLIETQRVINQLNHDPDGQANHALTGANIGWLIFGGVLWLSVIAQAIMLLVA